MELEWIRAFLAAADAGSFSAAADALYVSQSVISKQIRKLETCLDTPLFQRAHRRVELTAAGRRAYPEAQALLRQWRCLEQAAHPGGALHLVLLPVADCYGIPQLLGDFSALHPQIQLTVEERENTAVPALLKAGLCDGAFYRTEEKQAPAGCLTLWRDELALLAPDSLPCPDGRVHLSFFQDEKFLLLDAPTGLLEASLSLCSEAGFSPQVRYTGSSAGNIGRMVRGGVGVALLARRVAESCLGPGLKLVEIQPNRRSLLVFSASGAGLRNPAMAQFQDCLALFAGSAERDG